MEDEQNKQTSDADITNLIAKDKTILGKGGHVLSDGLKKSETSPLHDESSTVSSGKDVAQSQGLKIIISSAVSFSAIITLVLVLFIYLGNPQVGASGAVASDIGQCSDLGLAVLKRGGNSVDAAVTTVLCQGLINSHSSGIGGGGFMLVYDHKTKKSEVLDFREVAPSGASTDVFKGDKSKLQKGSLSVGVPGELKGLEEAHRKYGKLVWKSLVDPITALAKSGFKVTKSMDDVFKSGKLKISDLSQELRKHLVKEGEFVKLGMTITRPDLAIVMGEIAQNGANAVYYGKYAREITKTISDSLPPGVSDWLTEDDLQKYKVKHRDVVQTTYHDSTVMSVPAPGSGLYVLSALNMLEGYSLSSEDPESVHKMIEAFKFAGAQQQSLGDPDFNKDKIINITQSILDKNVARKHRNMTTNVTQSDPNFYSASAFSTFDKGTSHVSIIDAQELMVSVTSTINSWFGSMLTTPSGIVLNNQMAHFEIPDQSGSTSAGNQMNYIAVGKRPQSNLAPTILYNTKLSCSLRVNLGATNGNSIPSAIVQTILNTVSYNMNFTAAIKAPRLYAQLLPSKVFYEENISPNIINNMTARGHVMEKSGGALNSIQGVKKIRDKVEAYSDKRDGGRAAQF